MFQIFMPTILKKNARLNLDYVINQLVYRKTFLNFHRDQIENHFPIIV
jgi:hypothetical protein